jgi:alkylation response protein AidB-like acyl-CoA dehydrogenase
MPSGLDRDDLDMVLDAIRQYARSHLPDTKLRELDAADEFPEGIVREMCGEGLGVSLLFISEEFGGMGGSAMDIYRVCERCAGHLSGQRSHHVRRHSRAAKAVDDPNRQ